MHIYTGRVWGETEYTVYIYKYICMYSFYSGKATTLLFRAIFFLCRIVFFKSSQLIRFSVSFWQPEFKVSHVTAAPYQTNVSQPVPSWRRLCRFVVTKNNYNITAWCSVWSRAAEEAEQAQRLTQENQTRIVRSHGRMIVSMRAFVSKAKALDVMWKPFCVMCSHGIHITYICRMKKYIEVGPEGPSNSLRPAVRE